MGALLPVLLVLGVAGCGELSGFLRTKLPTAPLCQPSPGRECGVPVPSLHDWMLQEDRGCMWLVEVGGDGREVRIVWPEGYTARFNPFVVFDAQGREVARAGDMLRASTIDPLSGDPDACGRSLWIPLLEPIGTAHR